MKKYLLTALAVVGIISCSKVETVGPQPDPAITFGDSFVEVKTRAAADPQITTTSIDAFYAWAYVNEQEAMVLNKETVTKDAAKGWTYTNIQYWLPSSTYYFGAIAPVGDDKGITVNTATANKYGLGTVSFVNNDGSVDLIYAAEEVKTAADVVNNDPGKVELQFSHLLSKVKFTFTNGFVTDNAKITVKNIKMEVPKSGTLNLAQEDWWSTNAWTVTSDKLILDFGDVNGGNKLETTKGDECANVRFTIPDDDTRLYTITFDVALYLGTYETPAYQVTRTVELTKQEFKIGKSYNFKTTIGPENIHPDGPLRPIVFDVEVKPWEEAAANELPLKK